MTATLRGAAHVAATLFDCLRAQAQRTPHAWALLAPGRRPLTYAALLAQVQHTVAQLLVFGVGRGDRVAVVVGNGPEQAAAILGTAAGATCAPLNPGLTAAEFSYHLARVGARALIVHDNETAVRAARGLDIPVLALVASLTSPAGSFTLQGELRPLSGPGGAAQPDDVALLLHTAGASARARLVPLTHRHLLLSAQYFQPVFRLSPADRALNILPYYQVHGFSAGLMASLLAGASVVCTPDFSAPQFLDWLREYQPTWYTASPVQHETILAWASEPGGAVPPASLRFMRSGGAALPAGMARALEERFRVPVLEGYGVTEADPIASNPLPPRARKPGSVGPSVGPELGIMTSGGGSLLPPGAVGEVVVRGPSVMTGYAGDALANVERFTGDWLRTGDRGYLDEDGYLFLSSHVNDSARDGQGDRPA
jgi:acyl-CoA synthetase (AMP-forming)/AMP-acid ligase II